jgi:hypothetical protein
VRDCDELEAATYTVCAPKGVGRIEIFLFAPDEDGTGTLGSLPG